jgi:hypothetical protein
MMCVKFYVARLGIVYRTGVFMVSVFFWVVTQREFDIPAGINFPPVSPPPHNQENFHDIVTAVTTSNPVQCFFPLLF